ncbi:hypothetical protein BM613_06995 [Sulfoacidibacillus thermotolerans]|uniref:Uncharacterized protein n=1 Tax=Sulfoacidibacillus thermotolerans TaxID=1765684 RepID=A0A2U3D8X2_SULT2|nr:hypothetical protein BM613_06995 [Sulfoacidibacillus thermotolerans]
MCGFLKRSADSFIPEVGQSQDAQTLCAKIDQTLHDVEEYYEKHPAGRYLYSRNGHVEDLKQAFTSALAAI